MVRSVDHVATGGHTDLSGHGSVRACAVFDDRVEDHSPTAANICVDVCSSCYHPRPSGCLWSMLEPEAMLMSVVWAISQGLVWVCDPITIRAMLVVCAVTRNWVEVHDCGLPADCAERGSFFGRGIYDCRCTVEKEGHTRLL